MFVAGSIPGLNRHQPFPGLNRMGLNRHQPFPGLNRMGLNRMALNRVGLNRQQTHAVPGIEPHGIEPAPNVPGMG